MPELPEVEVICRQLNEQLRGKRVQGVEVYLPKSFHLAGAKEADLIGAAFTKVARRGKYIIIETDSNVALIVHLRMTGALIYTHDASPYTHVRTCLHLDDGDLLYKDVRTFGGITVLPAQAVATYPALQKLGREPLSEAFNGDYLYRLSRGRTIPVKSFLLQQDKVAGIGNIYADEALFVAGIRPTKAAGKLTKKAANALAAAIQKVMRDSIAHGGTSFRDYRDGNGRRGEHVHYLQVYGRGGEPCRRCGKVLKKVKVGGRASVYCTHCQK